VVDDSLGTFDTGIGVAVWDLIYYYTDPLTNCSDTTTHTVTVQKFVKTALQDADVLLLVTDIFENSLAHEATLEKIAAMEVPVIILINKVDLGDQEKLEERVEYWNKKIPRASIAPISALHNFNIDLIMDKIIKELPVAAPFFPKDELTDKPMKFFASEIVREKILTHFKQEIPYSCEVVVEEYKEEPRITRIRAEIRVARESQKKIVIGAGGSMIKRVGTDARIELEAFLNKKVFLDLYVKVDKDWRNDESKLKRFGYFD
jgi:GTP-binding protein Era